MCESVDIMVGRQLRQRRQQLGLTQVALAAACGLSVQQVQRYECAYDRLTSAVLWKLAGVMGVEVGYFFATLPPDRDAGPAAAARQAAARLASPAITETRAIEERADEERSWGQPAGWFNLAPWRSENSPAWSG